jgi:hypothetical protein
MDGPQNGYGSYFSPANFSDAQDSSIEGEFTGTNDYVSVASAVENLSIATTNAIESAMVTEGSGVNNETFNRNKSTYNVIRAKLIQLGCAGHLEQLEKFMKPVAENELYKKVKNIGALLDREDFNGFSKDFFSDLTIDISGVAFFKEEIGMDLDEFRAGMTKVSAMYDKAYFDLFERDGEVQTAVKKFVVLSQQIDNLLTLEVNSSTLDVLNAFNKYMINFFKQQNIKEKFDSFVLARKRFSVYRDIVTTCQRTLKRTDESPDSSACVICMQEPVKMAFVPCGHTFCLGCATKLITTCYICRAKINNKLKLYFN